MEKQKKLEEEILRHKALYYQGRPEISDHKYDELEEKLRELDPNSFALKLVGASPKQEEKVKHQKKMLSLNKTYKEDDLVTWTENREVVTAFKIDGVSCSLVYENGELVLAKTRGDGSYGENITKKCEWVNNIPKKLANPINAEVRGELYCDEENFFALSEEMVSAGLDRPTSQRNIVAGLIGRKENIELCRYLKFFAFDIISKDINHKTEWEKLKYIQSLGMDLPVIEHHKNPKSLKDEIQKTQEFMSSGEYLIDGLVITYNDLALHDQLGETSHHPRYRIAFKFQGVSKVTQIDKIEWSISRNGIYTPVAKVEPVELSGAKISSVTLHNYGMVKQYNLKKGDKIEIIRSGEVIPKFLAVVEASDYKFSIPKKCEWCDSQLEIEEIRLFCRNKKCPGIVRESILNFIKKMGIDDISGKRLNEMIKKGLVKDIPDLYKISEEDLLTLDKTKEKLAKKLTQSIANSKNVDITTFLSSLGISGGAYNKCEKVVTSGYNTIEKIKSLTLSQLTEIESFAEKSAEDFLNSLKEKHSLIDKLLGLGFDFKEPVFKETKVKEKKFCITGALSRKRSEVEKAIRDHGGVVTGSVSKTLDYLVTNETNSTSSKFKKATSLSIPIITEDELFGLMEE